jgi:HAMP domain-containing protein
VRSISRKLDLLVMVAVIPALIILVFSGIEQRRQTIEAAKQDVVLLAHTMAEVQKEITSATKQTLSTLAIMPVIQNLDIPACSALLKKVSEQNPIYIGLTLTDTSGDILATNRPFKRINLANRKHISEALAKKDFAAGEYIVTKIGGISSFAFAYPVLDEVGKPKAVLAAVLKLDSFVSLFDVVNQPERSFLGVTDHKGLRLFYYPPKKDTNPVGKPIRAENWEIARKSKVPGTLNLKGSDGKSRVFAFEQIHLHPGDTPYMYVWAGIPESHILKDANILLARNLLIMFLVAGMALAVSRLLGKNSFIAPIKSLVGTTQDFAQGNLGIRSKLATRQDELGRLGMAFNDMAASIDEKDKTLNNKVKELQQALEEIKTLRGILPICASCKKIRDDKGYWSQIESYIRNHSEAEFSHGLCPECVKQHYPEFADKILGKKK